MSSFDINNYTINVLNKLKMEKRIETKELKTNISKKENIIIIKIVDNLNYKKSINKLTSACNIKCLNNIISFIENFNENNEEEECLNNKYNYNENNEEEECLDNNNIDNYEVLKNYNIIRFPQKNTNRDITIINIELDYDLIRKIIKTNNNYLLPNSFLNIEILNLIIKHKNFYIYIDPTLSENVEELSYIITYISYYFSGVDFSSIKYKCKTKQILRFAYKSIKQYFDKLCNPDNIVSNKNNNIDYSTEKYKEQLIKDDTLVKYMGAININLILRKLNIRYMSKNKMINTIKLFDSYLKKFYKTDNDGIAVLEKLQLLIDTFKIICNKSENNSLIPPTLINLGNINNISIQMPSKDTENIKFIFNGDNDTSERSVSYKFFERADDKLIYSVFEDIYFHNLDKIEKKESISITLLDKKVLQNKSQKEIFTKIIENMQKLLSKHYQKPDVENESNEEQVYFKFKRINKNKRKREVEKQEIEKEIDAGEYLNKMAKLEADQILEEKKIKNKSKKKKIMKEKNKI